MSHSDWACRAVRIHWRVLCIIIRFALETDVPGVVDNVWEAGRPVPRLLE